MSKHTERILGVLILGAGLTMNIRSLAADDAKTVTSSEKTIDQFGTMLRQMGFDTSASKTVTGRRMYRCKVRRGTWKFTFRVSTSRSGKTVYVTAGLGHLKSGISPYMLTRLLQQGSYKTGKIYFVASKVNRLEMHLPIDNRAVTAKTISRELNNLFYQIKRTANLWRAAVRPR